MSVLSKLMQARILLQNEKLQKTGVNKFSNYIYFQLEDFLPQTQKIFADLKLCGLVSYTSEIASLTITDTEDNSSVIITSPMAEAQLKGCHPIQNLGAVETYQRRYLWVTAMEMVEHEALDETIVTGKGKGAHKPTNNQDFKPDPDEETYLLAIVDSVIALDPDYQAAAEKLASENLDADEKVWVWDKLGANSSLRSGIKKYNASLKKKEA